MTIQTFTAGQRLTALQMNTLQGSDFNFTRNVRNDTSYTFAVSDKGKLVESTNAGAAVFTIANDTTIEFDVGDRIDVLLASTGSVTITPAAGVTLYAEGDLTTLSSAWTRVTLIKRAANSWVMTGGGMTVQTVELDNGSVTSAKIADGTIVNGDINASAGIELSKLATGTAGTVVVHNSSGVPTATAISGDITISNTGVATIAANSVALGTDTTGNYVTSLVAGTGITLTNGTASEGGTPTIAVTANTYQPLDTELTALATVTSAADALPYFTGSGTATTTTLTTAARSILDDTSVGAIRTTLGVGTSDSPTFAGAAIDAVQVGVTAANEIDTTSGNLVLDSFAGTVQIDDNVSVTGTLVARASAAQDGVQLQGRAGGTGTFEVTLTPATLSGDRTLTLPDASGTVALVGGLGGVTLGTDTNGDYVASLVAGTGVTVTNNTGEGATPTVAIGQAVGTSASVTFGQMTTTGNVVVGGNLTVSGTTTTINTATLSIADNIVTLNSDFTTGTPTENAGIEVLRGSLSTTGIRWNETNDRWEATNDGTTYGNIVTTADTGTITSTMIADGTILNADINSAAAIAHSKLANATAGQVLLGTTTTGVVTATTVSGDVTITGGGVTAIGSGVIVNDDINASAGIALSKLATSTAGNIIVYNSSGVPTAVAETGDVTISDAGVTAIASGVIVNADISSTAAIEIGKIADVTIDTKTANYTLALTDKNKFIEMNLAGANTVSVPTNSVAFPIGSQIHITQYGAGKTQVVAVTPGTTTIRSTPGAYLRAQYSSATLIKRATEEWYLVGDLSST